MAPEQQASAEGMAVEGAEDEGGEDLAATTSMEAAGVSDTAATTRATDAVAADSTASATIVTRADICGAIATISLMDGLLLKAKRVEDQEEGEEEAVEAVAVAEVVLQPSPVKHVTSALGQRAEVKCMGKAMFKGADGKMVGLKNVLWVPNLAANLISVRRLQKAGMDTSSKGAKTYTARLGERIHWVLHEDRDVYNEVWQIPVVPMPKERQVAASISTKGEAVGSGDGANGRAKEMKSNKCNLGGTRKLGEHEESGAAAQKLHKGEENPKAAAEEEYGENMWGTIASAAFSNPTSATGECDWLTLHRRMGHVALPILQQLVKNEMVAGIRVKGEPDEVLGCPTCMQAKFTRYPFTSSEATAKAPLDEVVMDMVGPLQFGAAGAVESLGFSTATSTSATPFLSILMFDHTSGAAPAPPATIVSGTRSQWLTRDVAARLAIRNHLPLAECAHFGQHWTAQALYDTVDAHYSSPATAALGRLLLPYLFPELSAFATEDMVSHLCTSDADYRAALPTEFLDKNLPPMYIILYFIVTRLPDSLRAVRDHFLALDPTALTVDVLEQNLLVAETSVVTVGAARGTPRTNFFEGCSPSPLAPSYASATAVDVLGAEDVGAASATAKRRNSKGKGGRGGGGGSRGGGSGGSGGGSGGFGGSGGGSSGSGGSGSGGRGGGRTGAQRGGSGGGQRQQQQRWSETPSSQQLQFDDEAERPRWAELLRSGVAIFDLDYDAILAAMYALSVSAEGDCYLCVLPNQGIEAAALGASEFVLPVTLADPSKGPVLAHSYTVLPCPAVPSGSLSGLHLPSFSTNLVSAPGQVAPPCLCRLLSHQTLLWHHRLGRPSKPCLRGMHSLLLISGLPRSLPPLPPSPAPPCLPCVEGRQRAAPHSSSFPTTTAPLQTLHMDVWGPTRVSGQGRERYFLLVVDDYTRYTTVFPLRSKGQVVDVLIPWIRAVRLQLRERLYADLPVLRVHSDRGGEFSSDLLRDFFRGEGILQSFTLPNSPQQNGIAGRHIGLVMEVARTSMIHAAPPHFLWPFAVRYAEHQLNLCTRVSLPETSPSLRWTEKVGDASVFWRVEPGGIVPGVTASWGAEPARANSGGFPGVRLQREPLSPQRLREWYTRRCRRATGAAGARAPGGAAGAGAAGGAAGAGAVGGASGAGAARAAGAAGPGGARTGGTGAAGASGAADVGAAGTRAAGAAGGAAGAGAAGAASPGGFAGAVLGLPPTPGPPPLLSPPPVQSQSQLQPASPLPGPSPYSRPTRGLTGRREPESRPVPPESRSESHVRTVRAGRRVSRLRPPLVPGTHSMTLRPSTAPQRVPLLSPPASSLPDGSAPESDSLRAASPTVSRFLANAVIDPLFESTAASTLIAELVDFAAVFRLDYATSLVAESASASVCPPSIGGECALGTDVLEDRQEEFECFAAALPHLVSMLLAPEGDPDAPDIPTPRSYAEAIEGTYIDDVTPPGVNIVTGMWIFRVKRPPGSPPVFKARYVARDFSQRLGVDFFQTFSPTPKMNTLRVLLHVAAQLDYELHSLDFSTAFLQGSLHKEIWLRRPPGFTGLFPAGTQCSLRRPVYGLRQAPCEWRDTLRTTLAALGFAPSTADPSLLFRTDTTLPPFYVLVYVDDLVLATADNEALAHVKSELQKRHTCTDLGELTSYLGLRITRDRAQRTITLTQSHMVQQVLQRFGFMYSSPQSTPLPTGHSLSAPPSDESVEPISPTSGMGLVLGGRARVVLTGHADASWVDDLATQRSSSCEAEIYTGAMAAQELRWLTYLLTDLGETPRSPRVLYQRGELRLAYVASQANTADVFTKALQPCDHQRFCTVLGLVPTVPHLLTS
ncbi:unnamed protein product [Closterium sp. NIES-53]